MDHIFSISRINDVLINVGKRFGWRSDLWDLTSQVAANNGYRVEPSESDTRVMNFLRSKIKHIIYVVKENRSIRSSVI